MLSSCEDETMGREWQGLFVAIEGIDGAGLSTQTEILADKVRSLGKEVLVTKEPTSGPIGQIIRKVLHGELKHEPCVLALLFAADRAHHFSSEILPALLDGQVVISDRYILSSLAYQGLFLPTSWVKEINSCVPPPDLCILIDVDESTARKRIERRGQRREIFEKEGDAELIRRNYLRLAEGLPWVEVVDGRGPIEQVADLIWKVVRPRLEGI
ncbi:MAG: dTMP kinase [Thermoproteota archaeon]|nr:MAG: dTMP kinase [Candidatus Korarchaeota archaeon]